MIEKEFLDQRLSELEFSERTHNCFKRNKIQTIDDLTKKTRKDLLEIRCFGAVCLNEVVTFLYQHGLYLKDEFTSNEIRIHLNEIRFHLSNMEFQIKEIRQSMNNIENQRKGSS